MKPHKSIIVIFFLLQNYCLMQVLSHCSSVHPSIHLFIHPSFNINLPSTFSFFQTSPSLQHLPSFNIFFPSTFSFLQYLPSFLSFPHLRAHFGTEAQTVHCPQQHSALGSGRGSGREEGAVTESDLYYCTTREAAFQNGSHCSRASAFSL